jgi:hypothetical protein
MTINRHTGCAIVDLCYSTLILVFSYLACIGIEHIAMQCGMHKVTSLPRLMHLLGIHGSCLRFVGSRVRGGGLSVVVMTLGAFLATPQTRYYKESRQ